MYAGITWRTWLDSLGWSENNDALRTRGLTPSDRRLARHIGALRRSWCDQYAYAERHSETERDSDDTTSWATDSRSGSDDPSAGTPRVVGFTKARLDAMVAERVATLHGLGVIDGRDLEELDVCITSLGLAQNSYGETLDIALLQLRRVDELLTRHTLGEAAYRQMVADRHRAAASTVARSIGDAQTPSVCSAAQRRHMEMSRTPDATQGEQTAIGTRRETSQTRSEVPAVASLRTLPERTDTRAIPATGAPAHNKVPAVMSRDPEPAHADTRALTNALSPTAKPWSAAVQPDRKNERQASSGSLPRGGDEPLAIDHEAQQPLLQRADTHVATTAATQRLRLPEPHAATTDATQRLRSPEPHAATTDATQRLRSPQPQEATTGAEQHLRPPEMNGRTTAPALEHKEIRNFLADSFAEHPSAQLVWVKTSWTNSTTLENGVDWVGRVTRHLRKTRVGPWDVTWTHRELSDGTFQRFEKDGEEAPYVGKIPRGEIMYTSLIRCTQPLEQPVRAPSIVRGTEPAQAVSPPTPIDPHSEHGRINGHADGEDHNNDDDDNDASNSDASEDGGTDDMAPLPAMWTASDVPTSVFQCGGTTTPCLAALKGSHMKTVVLDDSKTPALARLGLVKTTRQGHKRILRELTTLPQHLQDAPLVTALIENINSRRREKRWQWSTTLTRMAATQGALRLLPLYSGHGTIDLRDNPMWAQAMRTARRQTQCEVGYQPKAISAEDLKKCVSMEKTPAIRAALITAWATAARGGCTLQLRAANIELLAAGKMQVQFRHGKSVIARGPYTVHTTLPEWSIAEYTRWFRLQKTKNGLLFPNVTGEQLKLALRRVDKLYEQRSIRRGSLQAMSLGGCSDEDLLLYSGHTNLKTLRRYLDWGKKSGDLQRRMPQHAEVAL
jgi:hypothetical protein